MLDGLDIIPWSQLQHAYGAAEDVPDLLRALAGSEQESEDALGELFATIWHQGTVYEASSYAVPFLVELAVSPEVARRGDILSLIGSLAEGTSYLDVHARPDLAFSGFLRDEPDFEQNLTEELADVARARAAVAESLDVICRLLTDDAPLIRAAAAWVLTRFPERCSEFGPSIRLACANESHSLARAGLLWCLGAIGDDSTEANLLLTGALDYADPRQRFAAAVALFRIAGELNHEASSVYRPMTAAKWFAESFLVGVPWDWAAEVDFEEMLADVEPDPVGATRTLLEMLDQTRNDRFVYASIVHDLLEINFIEGNWRQRQELSAVQRLVLQRLVETDAIWQDTQRLWFLVPGGINRLSEIAPADIENARREMRRFL